MMGPLAALGWLVGAIVVTVGITEAVRRLPAWVGLTAFLVVPLVMAPVWLTADVPVFRIVKTYSVCLGVGWVQGMKIRGNDRRLWFLRVAWAILAVNILEAVVTDLQEGRPITAVAGALLIASQPGPRAFLVSRGAGTVDMEYRVSTLWALAYTAWNLAFVVGTAPTYGVFALGHLVGPLVASRGRPELWLQARTMGLAILMFDGMTATGPPWLPLVAGWEDPRIYLAMAIPSVALALGALAMRRRSVAMA
jgi:hypothetical protein